MEKSLWQRFWGNFKDDALNVLLALCGTQRDCEEKKSVLGALQKTMETVTLARQLCSLEPSTYGLGSPYISCYISQIFFEGMFFICGLETFFLS